MKRHLIGIGGVGMSALATALVRLGDTVTGADRNLATRNIAFLESIGVRCFPDDGSGVDGTTDEVIVSTAIEPDNPGLVRAQTLGIPVTHRAKALARALADRRLVAVVGTCGKSTVTAMLGHVLAVCGLDPLCVNGANVPGWEGAVRFGKGSFAVAEVDESDRSLVAFRPYAAIVTNASADHYSKEEMDIVFDAFVKDCPGPVIDARGETYRPQDFNRQNASLAVRMAVALGVPREAAEKAMKSFGGVERRLQRYGADVYDDYAHNPEKLRAMWLALAETHPSLCVTWRPHGYAPLRKMLDALADMFAETMRPRDQLLLLPVYDAGGTTDRSVNSDALAAAIASRRPEAAVTLVPGLDAACAWMTAHPDFAACAIAGARDPGLPALAAQVAALRRRRASATAPSHVIRVTDPCRPLDIDLSRPLEIEVGCGKGQFLTRRAKANPDCDFLGIERMLERVRLFDGKCRRDGIGNARVLRLEALYTFHYLLPDHHARCVYVFFPDPWPKKKHHSHRLFGPLFLNALWKRLETGGRLEFATDHREYFETVCECFEEDAKGRAGPRFARVEPMPRPKEVWTEFETMFRGQGLPIYSAAWRALPADDSPLAPLTIPPEAEPREGIVRRV